MMSLGDDAESLPRFSFSPHPKISLIPLIP